MKHTMKALILGSVILVHDSAAVLPTASHPAQITDLGSFAQSVAKALEKRRVQAYALEGKLNKLIEQVANIAGAQEGITQEELETQVNQTVGTQLKKADASLMARVNQVLQREVAQMQKGLAHSQGEISTRLDDLQQQIDSLDNEMESMIDEMAEKMRIKFDEMSETLPLSFSSSDEGGDNPGARGLAEQKRITANPINQETLPKSQERKESALKSNPGAAESKKDHHSATVSNDEDAVSTELETLTSGIRPQFTPHLVRPAPKALVRKDPSSSSDSDSSNSDSSDSDSSDSSSEESSHRRK